MKSCLASHKNYVTLSFVIGQRQWLVLWFVILLIISYFFLAKKKEDQVVSIAPVTSPQGVVKLTLPEVSWP